MGVRGQDALEQYLHIPLNCKTFELESLCNIPSLATSDLHNTWLVYVGGVARAKVAFPGLWRHSVNT